MEQDQARPAKPTAIKFQERNVPSELRALARWVAWTYAFRGHSWTKVPINARTGNGAMPNNSSTWAPYAAARAKLDDDPELAGLGYMLGDELIGIDLDDCFDFIDGFSPLAQSILDEVPGYAEFSPSGRGLHIITRATLARSFVKPGLEIYASNRFFTITGDAVVGRDNTIPAELQDLSALCARHFGAESMPDTPMGDALANAKGPLKGWDLPRVIEELLPHLDPHGHYNEWLEVGAALHHQGDGDDEWLDAWDDWSAQDSERYQLGTCADKWETFGLHLSGAGPTTLATLIHRVKESRAEQKYDRAAHWATKIAATTDERELTDTLPKAIARDLLVDDLLRTKLAQQLQKRLKAATDTRYSIAQVRALLKPAVDVAAHNAPAWVKRYVYVADEDRFFDLERKIRYSRASFNATHNRDMQKNDAGAPIKPAADAATDDYDIRVVDTAIYHPALPLFYELDGKRCVNAYDDSQITPMPPVLLDEEECAIATVQRHIANILPDERERQLFTNWLAWVAQNPGLKIRWAPYLCGVAGDGKSFFTQLLKAAMGTSHVKSMNGDMLANSGGFSDWSVNRCVTVIEEAKLNGANKFDAANRIKPYITNPVIDVHPKGRASYNAPNTVNYMVLSNFLDGVPAGKDDRRFLFLVTPYTADSLRAFKAMNPDYDDQLFGAVENFPGAMRYWLLHYTDWHADFKSNGNAPITQMRDLVIEMSEGAPEVAMRAVFESRPGGVTDSWVAVRPFVSAVERELGPRSTYNTAQVARHCADFLRNQGYRFMGAERHRVGPERVISSFWLHRSVELEEPHMHNWWPLAEVELKKSFDAAAKRDFLD